MLPGAHRQVHQRANGWAIYWYAGRGGEQIGRFQGPTIADALDAEAAAAPELALAYGKARCRKPAEGLFARVIADYMAHPNFIDCKDATKKTYRVWLDKLKGEFGHCSEDEITDEAVSAWLQAVYAKHGARARDHAMRVLSRVASFGRHRERKLLSKEFKPTEGFESLYRAPAQPAWSVEDLAKIPALQPRRVSDVLMLALNTGLRRADLCRVAWTNVDWEAGVIRLITSKGERRNRRIVIPLTAGLRMTLQRIGVKRDGPILTSKRNTAWTENGISHAVRIALDAVGIDGALHGLRRSAATHLARQGLSSRKLARILGWSEGDAEAMSMTYVDEEGA
jgi:integrase